MQKDESKKYVTPPTLWERFVYKLEHVFGVDKNVDKLTAYVVWRKYKKEMTKKERKKLDILVSSYKMRHDTQSMSKDDVERRAWFTAQMKERETIDRRELMTVIKELFVHMIRVTGHDWDYFISWIKWEMSFVHYLMDRLVKYFPFKQISRLKYYYPLNRILKKKILVEENEKIYILWDSSDPNSCKSVDELVQSIKDQNKNTIVQAKLANVWAWDLHTDEKCEVNVREDELAIYYTKVKNYRSNMREELMMKKGRGYLVLTDLCSSTSLWNKNRFAMANAVSKHDKEAYKLMKEYEGIQLRNEGDSFLVAFKMSKHMTLHMPFTVQ